MRLVVFDVDGTLVDSQAHIHASMTHAFEAEGATAPPLAEVLSIVGLSLPEAVQRLAPEMQGERRARIVAAYKASFSQMRAEAPPPLYPGARGSVLRLAANDDVVLGIATGKSRRGLDHMLQAHDLGRHFLTRQVADDHPSKPHPSMLISALSETGCDAAKAVMIGDTSFDMEMGRAAGMATIGVAWGYHPSDRLLAAGAGRIVESFEDLEQVLNGAGR